MWSVRRLVVVGHVDAHFFDRVRIDGQNNVSLKLNNNPIIHHKVGQTYLQRAVREAAQTTS